MVNHFSVTLYHRWEKSGGQNVCGVVWVPNKCQQRLSLMTDNENIIQRYRKRFSTSSRRTITLRQVIFRSWTRISLVLDTDPVLGVDSDPGPGGGLLQDWCGSRSEASPAVEAMVLRDY